MIVAFLVFKSLHRFTSIRCIDAFISSGCMFAASPAPGCSLIYVSGPFSKPLCSNSRMPVCSRTGTTT